MFNISAAFVLLKLTSLNTLIIGFVLFCFKRRVFKVDGDFLFSRSLFPGAGPRKPAQMQGALKLEISSGGAFMVISNLSSASSAARLIIF